MLEEDGAGRFELGLGATSELPYASACKSRKDGKETKVLR